jgi:hypothetical protein
MYLFLILWIIIVFIPNIIKVFTGPDITLKWEGDQLVQDNSNNTKIKKRRNVNWLRIWLSFLWLSLSYIVISMAKLDLNSGIGLTVGFGGLFLFIYFLLRPNKPDLKKESDQEYQEYQENKANFQETGNISLERQYGTILGLRGTITFSDIKRNYYELLKKYHPDKLESFGEEFKIIAESKTKKINEAYSYFKEKYKVY